MRSKFLKISVIAISALTIFSACGSDKEGGAAGEPDMDAKEVVREGLTNLAEAGSASYKMSFDGSGTDSVSGDIEFDMSFNGLYNNTNRDNSLFSMEMDIGFNGGGLSAQSVNAELRLIGSDFYFAINEVSDFDGAVPEVLVADYIGKWWVMALPPEFSDMFNTYSGDESEMTAAEKEMKELFENTDFFTDLTFVGMEKIDGEDAYKYDAKLNNDGIVGYLRAFSESQDIPMTSSDIDDVRKGLELVDFNGSILVSKDDMILKLIEGTMHIEKDGEVVDLNFSYALSDVGEDLSLDAPSGAEEFDPISLLMGASALSGGGF